MASVQSPNQSRCRPLRAVHPMNCHLATSSKPSGWKMLVLEHSGLAGRSPSTTKVSQDFAARVGWLQSDTEGSTCQPNNDSQLAGDSASQPLEPISCFLAVGDCQIETLVETTDSQAVLDSSAPFDKIEWHIHIGEEDMKALEHAGWDDQTCYIDAVPQEGISERRPTCPQNCLSFRHALHAGHADCMRYWHGVHVASREVDNINDGDGEALWLCKQQYPSCKHAAQWGSVEELMYAHDILGLSWDECTTAEAAAAGSIDCLSFAHCSGCPWGTRVCSHAAAAGSMACLVYAHEHGCEWDWETPAWAALHGHLDCLVYAHAHGCEWDERTCARAAGNLEILTYAFENGCPWDASTCSNAAYAGSMECLVYAHELGCPWDATTCQYAAGGGRLQCLRYAHEQGCCWDEGTLYAAARAGDLDCLVYAHKHGCPYQDASAVQCHEHGLTVAAVEDEISLPCLNYVRESMGCSWDASGTEWELAFRAGRSDVLEYIHLHGGGWCRQDELLDMEDELDRGDHRDYYDGKAMCLLYMHCFGGCKLPPLRGTKAGDLALAFMQERRAAVLLSFHAADRARGGGRAADAAHAAMEMVPTDLIKEIICVAKLLISN